MRCNLVKYILFLFIISLKLLAQADLRLEYENSDSFKNPVCASIYLQFPDNELRNLYSDTLKVFKYYKEKQLKKGRYALFVYFSERDCGTDSIKYDFKLDGQEADLEMFVGFDCTKKLKDKVGSLKDQFVSNGRVSVVKYKKDTGLVDIVLAENIKSSIYYSEPFFLLKNHSNDTIYGEHLPGYFWGKIRRIDNDSINKKFKIGTLDYNFGYAPPLYPDSTSIATVGSFGYMKVMPVGSYEYELLYSTIKKQTLGNALSLYKEKKSFIWWVATKEYCRLLYRFTIG